MEPKTALKHGLQVYLHNSLQDVREVTGVLAVHVFTIELHLHLMIISISSETSHNLAHEIPTDCNTYSNDLGDPLELSAWRCTACSRREGKIRGGARARN
jgi:hypothetical protein